MALAPAEPCPQPKLLSEITVPTGGWQLKLYLSNAVQFNTPVTCTIAAGTYFMAWDAQTSDFLWELAEKLNLAVQALGAPFNTDGAITFDITDAHKVRIHFDGPHYVNATKRDVKIAWTELNGSDIAKVLGFDHSADDQSVGTAHATFTGDYHHAYGWYADDDGLLEGDLVEDESIPEAQQSVSPASGHTHTHLVGNRFANLLRLVFLPRVKTFSRDVGYTSTPVYPYERNEPLECWWKEAVQGKRFRYYRSGQVLVARAVEKGAIHSTASATVLSDTSKAWPTTPAQRWVGRLLYVPSWSATQTTAARWYINSNTAQTLTVANDWQPGYAFNENADPFAYYIFEQPYREYVLDLGKTKSFMPSERPALDKYDHEFRLLRYEA